MSRSQLPDLTLFATVAAHRSFRGAAKTLGLSPSAVSHAIRGLEEKLGVRLLNRTTRSVTPTEAGRRLLERLHPALKEIEEAVEAVASMRDRPAGLLRLTLPHAAGELLLIPHCRRFAEAFPDIQLELSVDDRFVDIVAAGFDAGIRLGESLERDMIAVRLGPPSQRMVVVASPAYLKQRGRPASPHDLRQHACIGRRFGGEIYRWELEKHGNAVEVPVHGPLILNDDRLMIDAALAGVGLIFVFEGQVRAELKARQLVRVIDDWCPSFPGFFVYYPSRRQMRPALRALIDFFQGALRE